MRKPFGQRTAWWRRGWSRTSSVFYRGRASRRTTFSLVGDQPNHRTDPKSNLARYTPNTETPRAHLSERRASVVERYGHCCPVWILGHGCNLCRCLMRLCGGRRKLFRGWMRLHGHGLHGGGGQFRRPRTGQRRRCRAGLAVRTRCELAQPAEKALRSSRSRCFVRCRSLWLWRLRLDCQRYQEQ
jgi:hypothetical protein